MKFQKLSLLLPGLFFLFPPFISFAKSSGRLVVADFDSGKKPNKIAKDWGSWNYDPQDKDQGTHDSVEDGALKLHYDVQAANRPAFNGFWITLGNLDVSSYEQLVFKARGDKNGKHTSRFKVELKNAAGERAVFLVQNLTPEWREYQFPFKKNPALTDWTNLVEFVVVFDDILATYKEGTVYLDQIEFQK